MEKAPIPSNEGARLASLQRINLLSTPAEADLDRIVRVAGEYFEAPIALFSLVDEHRQWFKSRFGLEAPETPRDISFCGHVIVQDQTFVVEDAATDARFHDNPLVVDGPRIKFYAGVPIRAPDGSALGTLCVIDRSPRDFSNRDKERLRDFGWWLQLALDKRLLGETLTEMISEIDQAKRESMIDPMTQTWNRRGFSELARREIARCRRAAKPIALMMVDIDHFKRINDTYGHPEGDKAIVTLARLLRGGTRTTDVLARLGGEEFAILLPDINRVDLIRLADTLRKTIEEKSGADSGQSFTVSMGLKWYEHLNGDLSEEAMVSLADKALYTAKQSGRNRVMESLEAV